MWLIPHPFLSPRVRCASRRPSGVPGERYTRRVLVALELRDFAIIDALRLEFAPGLNVLTGETGAGKSILVDALTLLIGGRADAKAVRAPAQSALVQGFFSPDHVSPHRETSSAPSPHPNEVAARRVQASGRSSARLDGELGTNCLVYT